MKSDLKRTERILTGLPVSPGLARGAAHIADPAALAVPEYQLEPDQIPAEIARFDGAIERSCHQLAKLKEKSAALGGAAAEELGFVLDAHLAMLSGSRLLRGVRERMTREASNAEAAIQNEITDLAVSFAAMEDPYLAARIDDIRVVGNRLIRNLTKTPFATLGKLERGSILLADELTPADTALIDPTVVGGFATVIGGADSHTAIMARALGLPAVLGCSTLLDHVCEGDVVIIDGYSGTVTLNPSQQTIARFEQESGRLAHERHQLKLIGQLPSVTRDGVPITLQANLELPRELAVAVEAGAAGIGLLRTEFLFMNREQPPSEDEQLETLLTLVRGMPGQEVTVRTLDIGGDKLPFAANTAMAGPNPALGLRAIRYGLRYPELLETQLAAILRASLEGRVRILLPMISSVSQIRATKRILKETAARLERRGIALPARLPPLGVMIELPAAALSADALALEVEFFSIGTNDLTQYTLGIDRGDEQVADLYTPLHPAVLRLIQFTTEAAARANVPVCLCGEMGGDPRCTALLIGLGIRIMSMAPGVISRVKQRVRSLSMEDAINTARQVMAAYDEAQIQKILDRETAG